jgi:TPR repeat protein
MYNDGKGVPQDYKEAVMWWRLAAEQGIASAQTSLGIMYDNGQGVPQDYAQANKWYRLAAEQGNASAQGNLGVMYHNGNGVLQDNVMAHMWYNIAAANGISEAGKWRDERASLMTQADISKAQAKARECMNSGYNKCGY